MSLLSEKKQTYWATHQGIRIDCSEIIDGDDCNNGWKQRGGRSLNLWLGNSQLYAINQMKENDVNGVKLLYDRLAIRGGDLLAFSELNASLQEYYVLFEYLKSHLPVSTLLLPAVFNDTRENGVRDSLACGTWKNSCYTAAF